MPNKAPAINEVFVALPAPDKDALTDLSSPLRKTLGALVLAEDVARVPYHSVDEIHEALEAAGVGITKTQISRALSRAGPKVSRRTIDGVRKYRVMNQGRREVENDLLPRAIQVSFVEAGRPRTARRRLEDLLGNLQGVVRVCDPYYGLRTLDTLELIPPQLAVRFLTIQTTEKAGPLGGAIQDFRREHPNTELRRLPAPGTIHDRYTIDDTGLLVIGHGLKDIGGKDSFVIAISTELASDLIASLRENFDAKWGAAVPL